MSCGPDVPNDLKNHTPKVAWNYYYNIIFRVATFLGQSATPRKLPPRAFARNYPPKTTPGAGLRPEPPEIFPRSGAAPRTPRKLPPERGCAPYPPDATPQHFVQNRPPGVNTGQKFYPRARYTGTVRYVYCTCVQRVARRTRLLQLFSYTIIIYRTVL